jgi:hypothetical protein
MANAILVDILTAGMTLVNGKIKKISHGAQSSIFEKFYFLK